MEVPLDETETSPEKVWEACLAIIRDNIPRQSYRTWFGPLRAVSLEAEDGMVKLTVQLPSQFYYEWLEEHYYALLRKTVAKILGPNGRLFYKVVIERDDGESGHGGASVNLPARPDSSRDRPSEMPHAGPVVGNAPREQPDPRGGGMQDRGMHDRGMTDAGMGGGSPRLPGAAGEPPERGGRFGPSTPGLFGDDDGGRAAQPRPTAGRRGGGHDGRSDRGAGRQGGAGGRHEGQRAAPMAPAGTPYDPSAGMLGSAPAGSPMAGQPNSGPGAVAPPGANPFAMPGIQRSPVESNLNASYVFERFIEGDCNRFARSAAFAVAEQPGGTSFNPLFVYGGVGLGKTHLIQAIGNFARAQRRVQTCLYLSSERFTTEFVQSIKNNRAAEFSLYYRNIDLLIVDDIQFFAGKERTQEEFFHIFNALHQSGKQIVLSSDRPPRDIPDIEDRLLSRFQWGLQADVKAPEFETRIAILQRKSEDVGIELDRDVIEFVAHNVKSNIRELEGALIRLIANSTLQNREVDLMLAKDVLRDIIKEVRVTLTVEEIQRIAAEYFNLDERLLRDKTRKREVVLARQVAMFFAKELTTHSLKDIGGRFGGRDHSTVIHGIQSIENQMETDPRFRETVEGLRHQLQLRSH